MQGLGFVRNRGEARGLNCLEMRGTEVGKGEGAVGGCG